MALLAPVVSWKTFDNTQDWPVDGLWKLGVVKAGFEAPETSRQKILIWNNRGGEEEAPDMQDVTFTTLNNEPGHEGMPTGPVAERKIITVRNLSLEETTPTAVGGETEKHIYTTGSTIDRDGVIHTPSQDVYAPDPHNPPSPGPEQPIHYPYPEHTVDILGVTNDGSKETAKGNYVELELSAFPPAMTPSGKFRFLMRVSYWY